MYEGVGAFADDEGTITESGVILCSANKKLLEGINKILNYLNLRHNNIKSNPSKNSTYGFMYTLTILGIQDYYKFVGFTHQIKDRKLKEYFKKRKYKSRKRELKLKS